MAGAFFIVSLPTDSYEKKYRPVTTPDLSVEHSNESISSIEKKTDLSRANTRNSLHPELCDKKLKNGISDTSLHGTLDSKSNSEGVLNDLSIAIPPMDQHSEDFSIDLEGDIDKSSTLPRSAVNLTSSGAVNSISADKEKIKGSEMSLLTIGKKIAHALTLTKTTSIPIPDSKLSSETLLAKLLEELGIENSVWNLDKSGNIYQVSFSVESGEKCEKLIESLNENGFGIRPNTTFSVIDCALFYKADKEEDIDDAHFPDEPEYLEIGQKTAGGAAVDDDDKVWNWNKFVSSVRARITVAHVVESVKANAELTFDFIMLLLLAGMVAALGLVENSSVVIVASMLISPLMGPIMAATFGTVIHDKQLIKIGILNELVGLVLCISVGFIFGVIVSCSSDHWSYKDPSLWPTSEMMSRGVVRCLWVGVLIALPSGAGVALSVLGGNASSLVGVAISASLLPPAVNAGLFWALAVVKAFTISSETSSARLFEYSENKAVEYATLGVVSLGLTLVNIACIVLAAVIVLKVKEVAPHSSRDEMKRFWKHDIKVARDYNRTLRSEEANDLRKQLNVELSAMSQDQIEALIEEAELRRPRQNYMRHISESGAQVYNGGDIYGYSNYQSTWTPGTTSSRNLKSGLLPDFRRTSNTGPSTDEIENLVYSTLTGGSRQNFKGTGRPSIYGRNPFRKISAMSLPGNTQLRSPIRTPPLESQLGTIKESSSNVLPVLDPLDVSQTTTSSRRFKVTPCVEDESVTGDSSQGHI